jgi:signal transduction histidine kinase
MSETHSQNSETNQSSDEWKSWPPEFFLLTLLYELRTPLLAIKGYTAILSDEKMKEHHSRALENISKNIENIGKLCDGITEYRSELESRHNT